MAKKKSNGIATEIRHIDPKSIRSRDKNARYMEADQMQRLVENVRADGGLTSAILAYTRPDGEIEVLSGHHRTKAAVLAEIPTIPVIVITSELSEEQKTAIQLSHNAIVGKDDKNTLAELYASMDLTWKQYSGLTDDVVYDFDGIDLAGIGGGSVRYEELVMSFLPQDKAVIDEALKLFEKERANRHAVLAPFDLYDKTFDAIVASKRHYNITNGAIAMTMIVELAMERLAQIEAESAEDGDQIIENSD